MQIIGGYVSKKAKTATALLLIFVMICPLFASCSKAVKNDVFDDEVSAMWQRQKWVLL